MITAIDTSVLIDVIGADSTYGPRSAALVSKCLAEGALVACEIVWAEAALTLDTAREFLDAMAILGVTFSPIEQKAVLRSSEAWRTYLRRGGKRQRIVADFLVGGHALHQADQLLTRDRGFYRDYFSGLRILDPSAQ